MTAISVIVPTYHRPDYLTRCLQGLQHQRLAPAQVIVVRREDDEDSARVLRDRAGWGLVEVTVSEPGQVPAMVAGARAAGAGILAFFDDDAVPRADWLARVARHFERPSVGAVGGRDAMTSPDHRGEPTLDVGRISPWGKLIGNHHLAAGPARDVMILKSAAWAFRRHALALPLELRGESTRVHQEVSACLWALERGWRLVLDPGAVVDHLVAPRWGHDSREAPDARAVRDTAFNLVASILSVRPRMFARRALFGLLVGDAGTPGLVRGAAALVRGEEHVARATPPALAGQLEALWSVARGYRMPMIRFSELDAGSDNGTAA